MHVAAEDVLSGPKIGVGDVPLPDAGPDQRLRWDLDQLHTALEGHRRARRRTGVALATEIRCTPSRWTNLRTARLADMDLTMRVTPRLARPAAEYVHATRW